MNTAPRYVGLLGGTVTLLTPLFLILSSLYFFMTPQFILWQYSQPGFPPADRFTPEQRTFNAVETVRYVRGEITLAALRNLNVYNEREIKHLVDVEVVARYAFLVHAISTVLIAVALFVLLSSPLTRPTVGRALFNGGLLTLLVIVAIGLFSLVAFDQFFVTFHRLFFEGDTWLFNYSDSLIQFYPLPFWETTSYLMAGYVAVTALIVTGIGWWLNRRWGS